MFGSKNGRERGPSSLSNNDKQMVVDALIGPLVTIRGDVIFSGSLYVDGRIEGNVIAEEGAANAVLTLSEQGHIEGEVRASVVILSGRLEGDVHASERIKLEATSRVSGNIHYQVVEMNAGAQLNGRLIHSGNMAALPAPEKKSDAAAKASKNEKSEAKDKTGQPTNKPAEKAAKA